MKKREEEARLLEQRKRDIVQYQDDKSEKRNLLATVANRKVKNKVLVDAFLSAVNRNVNNSYNALRDVALANGSTSRQKFASAVVDIALRVYFDALEQVHKSIEAEERDKRQKEQERQAFVKMMKIGELFVDISEQQEAGDPD